MSARGVDARAWVFQANPAVYDLDAALRNLDEDTWLARRYARDMHVGDRVFFWRAGENRGVVGYGRIIGEAQLREHLSDAFERDTNHFAGLQKRVLVRYEGIVDSPVTAGELAAHPVLEDLSVIRAPQGTNFAVTSEQARELEAMVQRRAVPNSQLAESVQAPGRSPSWTREELILALDLYLRRGALGAADEEVVSLSETLNRLAIHPVRVDPLFRNPNSVALKLANFQALDPAYEGVSLSRGGRQTTRVWEELHGDAAIVANVARALRLDAGLEFVRDVDYREIAAIPFDRMVYVGMELEPGGRHEGRWVRAGLHVGAGGLRSKR